MKTGFLFLAMILCLTLGSKAQKTDQKPNSPNEKSTVKREYDDKGNLIRFDSTYTYSSSGDTTLTKSLTPEKVQKFFSEHFGSSTDSSFFKNSLPDGFEQFFSNSFDGKQDSVLMKKFGIYPDSLALSMKDFDGFFSPFTENKNDSVLSKLPKGKSGISSPKSMDEMMKMIQKHMQEMEKDQQKYFNDKQKWIGL